MATNRHKLASWRLPSALLTATIGFLSGMADTAQAQPGAPQQVTVVSETDHRVIPVTELSGSPMIPLSAVAELVGAETRPASEQAVTVTGNGKVVRISNGRNFVSVADKLVMVQSPPRLVSGEWFVPLDFLVRVLPTLSPEALTYRESDRMLILGDAFPTLEVHSTRDPAFTRVEVTTSRPVPIEVSQREGEIRLIIQSPYLRTDFRSEEVLDDVVERISLTRKERSYELSVELGSRFGTFKASKRVYPESGVVIDLLRSRVPTIAGGPPSGEVETIPQDLRSLEERGEPSSPGETGTPGETGSVDLPPAGDPLPGDPMATDPLRGPPAVFSPRADEGPTKLRIVAIDPGHGGAEAGAEGNSGLVEKDLVLSVARRLRALLQDRLGLRVILTRDGDRNLALDERTALANNNKADVFISIHADASLSRDARGSSVYFLSYSSSESVARQVESARGRASRPAGSDGLDFILWDMAQASHLTQSSHLAEILQEELLATTGSEKINRGIKQNTFRVLKGATMPAVLVEVGFISNPDEEELLRSDSYQEELSEALYRGVLRFKDVYEYEPRVDASSQGPP